MTASDSDLDPGKRIKGARERALFFISIKERSRREVETWLRSKGFRREEVEDAVEHLVGMGLLDDERLAEMVAEKAQVRGWGRARTLAEMISRGISRETAVEVLDRAYPDDETSLAMHAAFSRWGRLPGDFATREKKLVSWMARMGYAPSTAFRVLEMIRERDGRTSLS